MRKPDRRNFIKSAGAVSASVMASGAKPAAASPAAYPDPQMKNTIPTMKLGDYTVSKLVLGSNPLGGYAHFNGILAALYREYYTHENIVKLLHRAHEEGVNLLQGHYADNIVKALLEFRESGKTMHWMFVTNLYEESQSQGAYRISLKNPKVQEAIRQCKPIGLIHHGEQTDDLFKKSKKGFEQVGECFDRIVDMGIIPGMSTHLPQTMEEVEENGWDCQFYMGCFYRCGKVKPDEWKQQTGVTPIDELYTEEMPAETCRILRKVDKPCFGYKILAAGRKIRNSKQVEDCYRYAFENMKPNDGVIVGIFNKFDDQMKTAADLTRKLTT